MAFTGCFPHSRNYPYTLHIWCHLIFNIISGSMCYYFNSCFRGVETGLERRLLHWHVVSRWRPGSQDCLDTLAWDSFHSLPSAVFLLLTVSWYYLGSQVPSLRGWVLILAIFFMPCLWWWAPPCLQRFARIGLHQSAPGKHFLHVRQYKRKAFLFWLISVPLRTLLYENHFFPVRQCKGKICIPNHFCPSEDSVVWEWDAGTWGSPDLIEREKHGQHPYM